MNLNLQAIFDNAIAAQRQEHLKASPQLTLGELILKLEAIADKTKQVHFAFEYAHPTQLDSWRGSYDELALGFSLEGQAPTVAALLEELKSAIGKTFEGYKGGQYVMGKNTPVWVANYGNTGNTGIVEVLEKDWTVILETKYCEY